MTTLKISPGIDGIPTNTIPDDPAQFVNWFKSVGIKRWLANADIRNAIPGAGISIAGDISTPATVAVSTELQSLFSQPYVLVGAPSVAFTDYRSLAAQSDVLAITDGGAESTVTVGVAPNGIGNPQLRQGSAASVIGNPTATAANVADIVATVDGQVLIRESGVLSFGTLSATALAAIANNTVLGNISGVPAAPAALTQAQLTALVNLATASLSGAMPALSNNAAQFLNGVGAFAIPAYPTGANPTGSVGLTAVNGSATTFMRSDGAPALSQAIAPTWTGAHAFAPSTAVTAVKAAAFSAATLAFDFVGLDNSNIGFLRAGGTNGGNIVFYDMGASAARGYIGFGASTMTGGAITDFVLSAGASGTVRIARAGAGVNAFSVGPNGNVVVAAPSSGDALAVANVAGANALTVSGNSAGTAVVRLNTQATTGSATPTLGAVKPGSNTAASKWLPVNVDGTTMYIPLWL